MPDKAFLYRDQNDEYRWIVKAGNGERIASATEGYKDRRDAIANYERVRGDSATPLDDLSSE